MIPKIADQNPSAGKMRWWMLPYALAAGLISGLGYAPFSVRIAPILGFAAMMWLTTKVRPKAALLPGVFFGAGFFGLTCHWMWPVGWWIGILLPLGMTGYSLLAAWGWTVLSRLPGWPIWMACWWISVEWLMCRFPLGGFGWIRLGFASLDTPYQGFLPYLATSGTSFTMALSAAGIALIATDIRNRKQMLAVTLVIGFGSVMGVGLMQVRPPSGGEQIRVGIVQGDVVGKGGVDALGYARQVTNNHYAETIALKAKVDTGVIESYDFVLWPENATDLDPTKDADTRFLIDLSEQIAGTPIMVGAVMKGPGEGERQTSALWWRNGQVEARYDKRNLVPFGEYTPFKDFLMPLIPILKKVGNQSVPGNSPGVLEVTINDGSKLMIGDIICYELAWDSTVYDTVRFGGEIVVVQSNNATWTGYSQPKQQFDITRVRAIELQRPIVVSTTASFSGHIAADGKVIDKSEEATAYSATYSVPKSTNISLAVRLGPVVEGLFAALGLIALLIAQFGVHRATPSSMMVSHPATDE